MYNFSGGKVVFVQLMCFCSLGVTWHVQDGEWSITRGLVCVTSMLIWHGRGHCYSKKGCTEI